MVRFIIITTTALIALCSIASAAQNVTSSSGGVQRDGRMRARRGTSTNAAANLEFVAAFLMTNSDDIFRHRILAKACAISPVPFLTTKLHSRKNFGKH